MRQGFIPTLTRVLLASAAFLGAALLFVVQPMLAKWLLPSFGGSPSTWAACMVFFQGMLLAGYAYAHALAGIARPRPQLAVHALFVTCALCVAGYSCTLPIPLVSLHAPAFQIAQLLFVQIGATYFALAITAPLVQRWSALAFGSEPYALYSLSNAGSLLGLLAYPFAIEPVLSVDAQFALWTQGFALYAGVMLALIACVRVLDLPPAEVALEVAPRSPLTWRSRLGWLAYAFLPSVMLLAVTNHITVDIAAAPLLWIAPLSIYLLTFIVAFSGLGARIRSALLPLWIAAVIAIGLGSFAQGSASLAQQLGTALFAMLTAGMLCHTELARTRPAPSHLTEYYLWIAGGGVLGSIFVSWLAPVLFDDDYELELCALAIFALLALSARAWSKAQKRWLYLGFGICVPLLLSNLAIRMQDVSSQGTVLERRRSFLGSLRVTDSLDGRLLTHGRIRHGMQLRDRGRHLQPTMYFGPGTAIEHVLRAHAGNRPRKIGVVGLGVGTIAAYARAGDRIRFYELDENVVELARKHFTFLKESAGRVEVALGDGRLSLASEAPHAFDVLVLDAFSSDAVPVHLLTREAFAIYRRQLAPNGVLLANVSNRHLAVDRVVRASARAQGLACRVIETRANPSQHVERVRWAVMARDPLLLEPLLFGLPTLSEQAEVLFTDARASLLSIVR